MLKKIILAVLYRFLILLSATHNAFIRFFKRCRPMESDLKEYVEIQKKALPYSDFSDHLELLFAETLLVRPKLMVELGTRGGDSTFVLERVAKLCGSELVSVDIVDCQQVSRYPRWHFVQQDDVAFAREFAAWCRARSLVPEVEVLFIDTSHLYEHTVQEIKAWVPLLAKQGKIIFHDTNLKLVYFRRDGSMGFAWNNHRGVIRAIEEFLGCKLDEKQDFTLVRRPWLVRHWSNCSGFTVLQKITE